MTELWLAIIGLLLVAVVILLWPLIKPRNTSLNSSEKEQNIIIFKQRLAELEQERNQGYLTADTFSQLKTELEKSLLTDVAADSSTPLTAGQVTASHWTITTVIAVLVVGVSLGIYFKLGRSDDYALSLTHNTQTTSNTHVSKNSAPSFEKIITVLEQKLQQNPSDIDQWFLLANSYSAIENYDKAAQALASAIQQIATDDPQLATAKGSYAQMLFQAAGEVVTAETQKAMNEALAIDPLESSALIIKGIESYTAGDLQNAIVQWKKAKTKASPQLLSRFIEPVIANTQAKLGKKPTTTASSVAITSARIEIQLDISPDLKAKTNPEAIVFIFAQKPGSRMPLAADRLQVKELPATIILDDSKSPMPVAKLSSVDVVDITARVSFTGQPQANKGDLFSEVKKVSVKASSPITIIIDQTIQ
jgi:cytochrome c-type biogenesis protein CcmH